MLAATRRIARSWVVEQVRVREREAQSAASEERVVLGLGGDERQRLVGAGVERADDQRPAVEAPARSRSAPRPARPRSAARCGRGRGTRCGAARRPRRRWRRPGRHRPRCRCSRTPRRAGRPARPARTRAASARARSSAAACASLLERGGRRRARPSTSPASPSTASVAPSCDREQRRAEADDIRDAERPGDDRRVVERAAARGRDAPRDLGVQARDGARGEQLGDDDAGLGRRARRRGAGDRRQDAVRHVADVDRASPEVVVVDPVEGLGCRLARALEGDAAGSPAAIAARAGSTMLASSSSSACAAKISASAGREAGRGLCELRARDGERLVEPRGLLLGRARPRARQGRVPAP